MENNSNTETLQICRTCMKELLNKSLCYNLDFTDANTKLTIGQKLYNSIPELDLNIVPNAIICYECADIVNSMYKFKNGCLQTKMKIHKHIQNMQQTDNDVNIIEVAQFHCQSYGNRRAGLKTEAFEVLENLNGDDPTVCDSKTCNEAVINTNGTERKYLLSLQKVELEDVLFNTVDNFITYSVSESKEISDTHDGNIVQSNIPQIVNTQNDYIQNVATPDIISYQCYTCGHKVETKFKLIVHIKSHTAKNQHHETSKSLLRNKKYITLKSFQGNSSVENTVKCSYSKRNSKIQGQHVCQDFHFKNDINQDASSEFNVGSQILKSPFKCKVCEYQCTRKSHLKIHMRSHTGEKPFKCSVCEYQSTTKGNVKVHMRSHTGEKPFKCSVCEYQFTTQNHLKIHMRIHTGEKPFKCSVCEYYSNRKDSLKIHMKMHTGEKPFKCSICEYRCIRKDKLNKHMRIHSIRKQ